MWEKKNKKQLEDAYAITDCIVTMQEGKPEMCFPLCAVTMGKKIQMLKIIRKGNERYVCKTCHRGPRSSKK